MIWSIPIEPIPNRYSADWREWFASEWEGVTRFIDGDALTEGIESGDFLDVLGTHHYKASQVMRIASLIRSGEIRDGDTLFFHDLWFPLEQVFYMLDALDLDVRVAGILHAGSYSRHDLLSRTGMAEWAGDIERAWFHRVDRIFVFSMHHARQLRQYRGVCDHQLAVVPFPYKLSRLAPYRNLKDIPVVFPARPGPDKGWGALEAFRDAGIEVVSTWEACRTKEEYFRTLGRARYVLAWPPSETFGIATMEAVYLGAMPLVPARLSYHELYPHARFATIEDAIACVREGREVDGTGVWRNAEDGFRIILSHLRRGRPL